MIWTISFNFIFYILHFATNSTTTCSCTIQVQLPRDNSSSIQTIFCTIVTLRFDFSIYYCLSRAIIFTFETVLIPANI